MTARLLAIEGVDGSGKSTLVAGIYDRLRHHNRRASVQKLAPNMVEVFKALADGPAGITGRYRKTFPPKFRHEAYLFEAASQFLINSDRYDENEFLIFDRYLATNFVYLGAVRRSHKHFSTIMSLVRKPSLEIFINTDPCEAARRLINTSDWMAQQMTYRQLCRFLGRLSERYLEYYGTVPALIVDGSLRKEELVDLVMDRLGD